MTREDCEESWTEWKEAKALPRLRREEYYAELRTRQICRWRAWVEQNEELVDTLRIEIDTARNSDGTHTLKNFLLTEYENGSRQSLKRIPTLRERTNSWSRKSPKPRAGGGQLVMNSTWRADWNQRG